MGPATALMTTLRNTFRFSGRATRPEFWWSWALLWCVAVGLELLRARLSFGGSYPVTATLLLCAVMLPMISVGTRRLADAGVWRWLFVLCVALSIVQQLFYLLPALSASDFWAMQFRAEREDVTLPLSGHDMFHLFLALRRDILPWAIRLTAIACLLLALLPSRKAHLLSGPNLSEVKP